MNIEILGVNRLTDAAFNPLVVSLHRLPWLQDTASENMWARWNVDYRDVLILDSQNRLHSVFNLTSQDLALQSNRAALKRLFLDAAILVDSDSDTLPDDWEMVHFGNLSRKATDDPDGDGFDNATEHPFGTNPLDAASTPAIKQRLVRTASGTTLNLTIRRRAGNIPRYRMEQGADLGNWMTGAIELPSVTSPQILFDGSGTSEATYSISLGAVPHSFFNIRIER